VKQFRTEEEKQQLDAELGKDVAGRRIIAERYGMTLSLRSCLMFVMPIVPVVVPTVLLLSWPAALGFCIPVISYPLMSKLIHPYLHQPYRVALQSAPVGIRWLLSTRYMRSVWRHHWLHHRYPKCNFNLLLGGDYLRGVHRFPSQADKRTMRKLGLPVD